MCKKEMRKIEDLGASIIATLLSALIFSFLLHTLNSRRWGVFIPTQSDLGNLSNTNRRILSFAGYVLAILITTFLRVSLGISGVVSGLVLGFLGALIDTCFRDNIIENITKENKE